MTGLKMMVEWFEREANQVDPEKDAMEDRLVELYAGLGKSDAGVFGGQMIIARQVMQLID